MADGGGEAERQAGKVPGDSLLQLLTKVSAPHAHKSSPLAGLPVRGKGENDLGEPKM